MPSWLFLRSFEKLISAPWLSSCRSNEFRNPADDIFVFINEIFSIFTSRTSPSCFVMLYARFHLSMTLIATAAVRWEQKSPRNQCLMENRFISQLDNLISKGFQAVELSIGQAEGLSTFLEGLSLYRIVR